MCVEREWERERQKGKAQRPSEHHNYYIENEGTWGALRYNMEEKDVGTKGLWVFWWWQTLIKYNKMIILGYDKCVKCYN